MKKLLCLVLILSALAIGAKTVSETRARTLAQSILSAQNISLQIDKCEVIRQEQGDLAYIYGLKPQGYIVISARESLPPLMAYSLDSDFGFSEKDNPLRDILQADLNRRLIMEDSSRAESWLQMENNPGAMLLNNDYLLSTLWNQTAPWNAMCPLDPLSNSRSVAGCPAVAMSQILNFFQSLNGTRFSDNDDYYHSFSGRNYTIDDDCVELDFPSFPELNEMLDEVQMAFNYDQSLSSELQAALVFACGTACKQIYSSQVSGTLSVNQAHAAFRRFGFADATLLGPDHPQLYSSMIQNLNDGMPLLLAMVTPAEDAGHNVVVDGFSDGMYHLNFGWGGQYNGWYSLPEEVPYNLTVVEGAVLNLQPTITVLSLPNALQIEAGGSQTFEVASLCAQPLQLMDFLVGDALNPDEWQINPAPGEATINAFGIMYFSITNLVPTRDIIESSIRMVFDNAWLEIPLSFSSSSTAEDPQLVPASVHVHASPNPFSESCEFSISGAKTAPRELRIYNLKGQLLRQSRQNTWDGRDDAGKLCPTGLYFYRILGEDYSASGKLIKR
ncbi:MAG: C10 family peptidase [Candidatus Cloacimonetes bacterium]|nr:C10 family peptidase [Candidatus Cloacimonadota bacterium]